MRDILLPYGIAKEAVNAMMILYQNIKTKSRSPDIDTDFFDINRQRVLRGSARIPWMAWKILFKKYFHWNCLKIYLIFSRGVGLSMIKHETIFSVICLFYSNDV